VVTDYVFLIKIHYIYVAIKLMFKINGGGKEDSVFKIMHTLGAKPFLFIAAFQIMWIIFAAVCH